MKTIKISEEQQIKLMENFHELISKGRFDGTKVSFDIDINNITKDVVKPTVIIEPKAYAKIRELVCSTETEIGWHGIVSKQDNIYTITDIMLFPQHITGTTVTSIDGKYDQWLADLPDETFNSLRFQGHSHVNMPVNPSGTDQNFYNAILQTLEDNDYYIFMIINKKNDVNIWIHDLSQNIIFEKADVTLQMIDEVKNWAVSEKAKYVETYSKPAPVSQYYSYVSPSASAPAVKSDLKVVDKLEDDDELYSGYGGYDGYSGYNDDLYNRSKYYDQKNNKSKTYGNGAFDIPLESEVREILLNHKEDHKFSSKEIKKLKVAGIKI